MDWEPGVFQYFSFQCQVSNFHPEEKPYPVSVNDTSIKEQAGEMTDGLTCLRVAWHNLRPQQQPDGRVYCGDSREVSVLEFTYILSEKKLIAGAEACNLKRWLIMSSWNWSLLKLWTEAGRNDKSHFLSPVTHSWLPQRRHAAHRRDS